MGGTCQALFPSHEGISWIPGRERARLGGRLGEAPHLPQERRVFADRWAHSGVGSQGVRDDFMTGESGAAEPLALEFQPPRTLPCACGFGLAAQGFAVIAQVPGLGWGPCPLGPRTSVAYLAEHLA